MCAFYTLKYKTTYCPNYTHPYPSSHPPPTYPSSIPKGKSRIHLVVIPGVWRDKWLLFSFWCLFILHIYLNNIVLGLQWKTEKKISFYSLCTCLDYFLFFKQCLLIQRVLGWAFPSLSLSPSLNHHREVMKSFIFYQMIEILSCTFLLYSFFWGVWVKFDFQMKNFPVQHNHPLGPPLWHIVSISGSPWADFHIVPVACNAIENRVAIYQHSP